MATLFNALQLKNGARVKGDSRRRGILTQPVQMLPRLEKDADWGAWNMDWLEHIGLKQLSRNAHRLLKNYKLAAGIIERSDYIPDVANEHAEVMELLTQEDSGALELKFFPLIPNIINVLVGEFAKRTDKISYHATDSISYNERLDEKYRLVEQTLLQDAEQQLAQQLLQQGVDLQGEEAQKALAPEQLRQLPQIEDYMQKSWKSQYEQWAGHQHQADTERFHLRELEITGFKDSLTADREFWGFELGEDDYRVSLWNPVLTFYHKSLDVPYVSDGNLVGKIELMSAADVIDTRGWKMSKDQLESMRDAFAVKSIAYAQDGQQNDGAFYDSSKSHEWNMPMPSLAMRQYSSVSDQFMFEGNDVLSRIMNQNESHIEGGQDLFRVTTAYWKSQMMVSHLTSIGEDGSSVDMIVDESFRVTTRPVYDNSVLKGKSRQTLIYGQHLDSFWVNQVWGGEKISQNGVGTPGLGVPGAHGAASAHAQGFDPIYLNVEPLAFQFKGDDNLYGCKLPVEGRIFSDRNTRSNSLVDKLKPFQVGYNMVNNQIADILIDELGTIVMLDQNALPKHSLGEDWGDNPLVNAHVAMKNFQMLPMDSSMQNTEQPLSFQHYQTLDLSQTQRLLSRVQLASFFKNEAFASIGMAPERMGAVGSQQSGTSIEQVTNLSYTQTEIYFIQHSEQLMPRVHTMRTDVAQHYHSTRPSARLSYVTSTDEQVNFEVNGTELLGRDIGVFCSTSVNNRKILEDIRALALSNTTGSSIFDLAGIVKASTQAEMDHALKGGQVRQEAQQAQEQQAAAEQQAAMDAAAAARQTELLAHEASEADKDRQNNIDVAEVRGAGMQTPDDNADYLDGLETLEKGRARDADRELKRQALTNQGLQDQRNASLKREDMATRKKISEDALRVARVNKNKWDKPAPAAKKK